MATVRFIIRSKVNKKVSISVYLSLRKGEMFQTVTGFSIFPKDWSSKTEKPVQNSDENRLVHSELTKLESFLYSELNKSQSKGEIIDTYWLKTKVKECFKRITKADSNLLITHIQHIIDTAKTRKIKGSSKIGLSDRRILGYKSFKSCILNYQKYVKKQITFTDINKSFVDKFTHWLLETKGYSKNYSGKQLDNLKTVCRDAESLDISVHQYSLKIESFKENSEDRDIITLTRDDLKKIKKLQTKFKARENVRKWILLGCEFGQRGSDLMRINAKDFYRSGDSYHIDIKQKKTGKLVNIGTDDAYLINIIEKDFPYPISSQRFNDIVKDVCEEAKINEIIRAKKYDKETKRKKLDNYKKHELISSHCFRRTFATNYYKIIPTTVLMDITGHTKESQFLEYINKKADKEANTKLFLELRKKARKPEMKVIRKSS